MRIDYKNSFDPRIPDTTGRHPLRKWAIGLVALTTVSSVAFAWSAFERNAAEPLPSATPEQTQAATAQPAPVWQPLSLPKTESSGPATVERAAAVPAPVQVSADPKAVQTALLPAPVVVPQTAADASDNAVVDTRAADSEPEPEPELTVNEHRIRAGENLASIFKRMGLSPSLLHQIVHSGPTAKRLADVRPGQMLRFHVDEQDELQRLELQRNAISTLRVDLTGDAWEAQEVRKDVERRQAGASGTIESSLFVDGQKAGLSDAQIMELAAIFGWDIDFALEIRAGDRFNLIYEEQYLEGEKFSNGPILAAEFVNRGTTYRAIRFEDGDGNVSYYDAEGRNKRRAFIRTPVKFARISSRFTNKRWHPVLKRWRSHKGVDYAAPRGTPIKATGNGKVVYRGTKGGYGRTVVIRHGGKYQTLYAHLSKYARAAKVGRKVKQGQVIGYVGSTGLATGPHLHYEFRVNGVHRNPLRVKLPKALPLPKAQMATYLAHAGPLLEQLDSLDSGTLVADAAAQQ